MRASFPLMCGVLVWPSLSAAHESHSANFRNLSAGAATSVTAAVVAPTPAPRPVAAAPAPLPPPAAPPPTAAAWLWAASAAGAAAAFLAAFATFRRSGRRDETLALAAHELKSPLAAIESYLALMEQDGRSGASDARAWLADVARMRTTTAHLRRTIGDMLEMTRLEDGRLRLDSRDFELGELARECAGAYGALAREAGVTLRATGDARAWGDPARARQILDNLIGNALRHAPAGGTVTVSCAPGAVTVADDGAGVPAGRRDRLFTRFARLSEPVRGETGTGLGLYIGRRLAHALGGDLAYAPGPGGVGSAFTLTLPEARS